MPICIRCWCLSEDGTGWFGVIAEDHEDGEESVVATYCPPCAVRELDAQPRDHEYV
jgi:hypothetical protein